MQVSAVIRRPAGIGWTELDSLPLLHVASHPPAGCFGFVLMVISGVEERKESNPHHVSTLKVSGCGTFATIPLTKANFMINSRLELEGTAQLWGKDYVGTLKYQKHPLT